MIWDCAKPFLMAITVQPHEIDGLGHTNNSCYITWAEKAAWQHTGALGLTLADYQQLDRAMAITKASYDYYLPSFAGDQLTMATWISACDNKLQSERRFQLQKAGKTIFRGHWLFTCVRVSTGKVARMPQQFIDTYGKEVQ